MKGFGDIKGFTLLEVLVALAVMAIAVTLLIELSSVNLRAVARSGRTTAAAIKAESMIRTILDDPKLAETSRSETTDDGYRTEVTIREVEKERTENLPVRMMEVVLTVLWPEGGKEKKISLTTAKLIDKLAATRKI